MSAGVLRHQGVRLALFALGRRRSGRPPRLQGNDPVVILVADAYGLGGTIRTSFNTAGWLARDHPVEIVSATRARDTTFFPRPEGVGIRHLDDRRIGHAPRGPMGWLRTLLSAVPSPFGHGDGRAYPRWNLWTDLQVAIWMRSLRGGVLITTRPRFNVLAAHLLRRRVALIGQEHLHAEAYGARLQAMIEREYGDLDVLTVLTQRDKEDYERLLSGRHVRVVQIPNAAAPRQRTVPFEERDTTIVAAGRLASAKGFDLLIEAWSRIEASWSDWVVEVYGHGAEREALETLIAERHLGGRVRLMGPTPDLGSRLETAGLFVLSSRREGFPLVLIEAMAAGCPVVSFDCPSGPREIVRDHLNGTLVPAESVEALAAAIHELLASPESRRTFSLAAVRTARSYDIQTVGARWDALLRQVTEPVQLSSRGGID